MEEILKEGFRYLFAAILSSGFTIAITFFLKMSVIDEDIHKIAESLRNIEITLRNLEKKFNNDEERDDK